MVSDFAAFVPSWEIFLDKGLSPLEPLRGGHGAIDDHLSDEMVGFGAVGQHLGDEAAMGFSRDFVGQLQFGQFDADFFKRGFFSHNVCAVESTRRLGVPIRSW